VLDTNPAFKNMIGWDKGELSGIEFPPFIVNMTIEEHQNLLQGLMNGQSFPYELVKRKNKDGTTLDILASYWSVNNDSILAIGMYKDFTEQMIQRKLEESEYCYRTLIEYLPESIIMQRNNKIQFVNSSGVKLLGKSKLEDIIGYSIWDFLSSDRQKEIQQIIEKIYDDHNQWQPLEAIIDKFVRYDGKETWVEVKVIPIGSKEKPDIQIVFRDVTEKKVYESQLEHLTYHDPLTGLKNRRIFTEIVTESLEFAKVSNEKLAIMYIDIDKFKLVNDTYGHDVGDQLLQQFANRLKSGVRDRDVLCRVGGDEFIVLLKGINEMKEIVNIAERLVSSFQEIYEIDNLMLHVSSSIGVAVFPEDGLEYRKLIYQADQALYLAKKERNQYKSLSEKYTGFNRLQLF
jgi:diguanylate cyclase (GGDEF)-like protein/PAS domain S-box-containing protein